MIVIAYNCRLCAQVGHVMIKDDESCEQHWIDVLTKILVCNPCADLRDKFKRSETHIEKACVKLVRMSMMKIKDADRRDFEKACRAILVGATRTYAECMAEYRNLESIVWHEDFVEQLMEDPSRAYGILKRYRAQLKTMPKREVRSTQADP